MDAEGLIREYLDRLEVLARERTPDQAEEIVAGVREHIEAAVEEAGRRDEATVRTLLDGLGSPEAIIAAGASEDDQRRAEVNAIRAGSDARRAYVGGTEIVALLLIASGVLLPFVGPLLGLVLIWVSQRWTIPVKIGASLVALVLLALPLGALLAEPLSTSNLSTRTPVVMSGAPVAPSPIPIASSH